MAQCLVSPTGNTPLEVRCHVAGWADVQEDKWAASWAASNGLYLAQLNTAD